jgi:hypothetical protein
VSATALRGLERALDRAADHGLRAAVALLGGSLGGALHLPEWAVGYRLPGDAERARRLGPPAIVVSPDQPAILAGDRYRREPARDLYGEPDMLEAQRRLLHEAIGNLAAHPAAATWLLGADLERARRPAGAAGWWADLAGRAVGMGALAIGGALSPVSLGRRDTLRPEQIVAAGGRVVVSAAPLPPLPVARPWDSRYVQFLHALAAGLLAAETGRAEPVIVAELGAPTALAGAAGRVASEAFGRPAQIALAGEDQQATLVEEALAALHRDGAAGAWLAAYADIAPELWRLPPADRSWWARSAGIVAPDGREKPAAAAARAFAARLRAGELPRPSGPPALPLDPERYWRDPAAGFQALWREWFEA